MRRTKLLVTVLSLGFAICALTHRLRACIPNTVCYPGGGCWFQCVNAGNGGSSNTIGASQPDYSRFDRNGLDLIDHSDIIGHCASKPPNFPE